MTHLERLKVLSRKDKFDYLMNLEYETIFRKDEKSYSFFIKKLGICCKAEVLSDLEAELEKAKGDYFNNILDFDLLSQLKFPQYESFFNIKAPKKALVAGKYVLLACFYLSIFTIGAQIFTSKLEKTGSQLSTQIYKALNPVEGEMKSRILTFRQKLDLLLPYIKEVEDFKKENKL